MALDSPAAGGRLYHFILLCASSLVNLCNSQWNCSQLQSEQRSNYSRNELCECANPLNLTLTKPFNFQPEISETHFTDPGINSLFKDKHISPLLPSKKVNIFKPHRVMWHWTKVQYYVTVECVQICNRCCRTFSV